MGEECVIWLFQLKIALHGTSDYPDYLKPSFVAGFLQKLFFGYTGASRWNTSSSQLMPDPCRQ